MLAAKNDHRQFGPENGHFQSASVDLSIPKTIQAHFQGACQLDSISKRSSTHRKTFGVNARVGSLSLPISLACLAFSLASAAISSLYSFDASRSASAAASIA